jgi:hypothetical protein
MTDHAVDTTLASDEAESEAATAPTEPVSSSSATLLAEAPPTVDPPPPSSPASGVHNSNVWWSVASQVSLLAWIGHCLAQILQTMGQVLFDQAVQLAAAFVSAVLSQTNVRAAVAQTIVDGMKQLAIDPDLDHYVEIASLSLTRLQPRLARQAGGEFPHLVGSFFQGMIAGPRVSKNHQPIPTTGNNNAQSVDMTTTTTPQQTPAPTSSSQPPLLPSLRGDESTMDYLQPQQQQPLQFTTPHDYYQGPLVQDHRQQEIAAAAAAALQQQANSSNNNPLALLTGGSSFLMNSAAGFSSNSNSSRGISERKKQPMSDLAASSSFGLSLQPPAVSGAAVPASPGPNKRIFASTTTTTTAGALQFLQSFQQRKGTTKRNDEIQASRDRILTDDSQPDARITSLPPSPTSETN